jgi:peptidyl-tRNA hydrolase, PTH1 family
MSESLIFPDLIVGLGNPGKQYDRTRHNIGFDTIDILAKSWSIGLNETKKFQGIFGEGMTPTNRKIRLLKPQTFMNLSGQSVRATIDWYKIEPEKVLVVYDDMDLGLGRLRLRQSGSAGGHNGMKSIISHLGTPEFPRLRIGIGKQNKDRDTISHVLGKFTPDETETVNLVLDLVSEAIEYSLRRGIGQTMNVYNNKNVAPTLPKPTPEKPLTDNL